MPGDEMLRIGRDAHGRGVEIVMHSTHESNMATGCPVPSANRELEGTLCPYVRHPLESNRSPR